MSVDNASQVVLYDSIADAGTACSPYLDSPIYPVSFPSSAPHAFQLWMTAISGDGGNLWIKGEMDPTGREIIPLRADCRRILLSPHDSDGTRQLGSQWLTGFYKGPAGSLYSIVHNEFYGGRFPTGTDFLIPSTSHCSLGIPEGKPVNPAGCTYTTLDVAAMSARSRGFHLLGKFPRYVMARPSFGYVPDVGHATGYFTNTNIVHHRDGFYYAFTVDILPNGAEMRCPIRTSDLTQPSSWKGWDGQGFTVAIAQGAECKGTGITIFPFYLGYNSYFQRYILVGATPAPMNSAQMGYALSDDLAHWSTPVGFGVPVFNPRSADWGANNYPSLVDPAYLALTHDPNGSSGALTGKTPWLVFVQHRDPKQTRAVAIAVTFSKQ